MRIRGLAFVSAVACLWGSPDSAQGQQVKVVREPSRQLEEGESVSYDRWTVSYSRRFAPDVFALRGTHQSLESAQAEARSIQEWSNTIESSDWKVAVILLEGSPSYRKSKGSGTGSVVEGFVERTKGPLGEVVAEAANAAKDVLGDTDSAMGVARGDPFDAGNVLGEYASSVEASYANAKQLKEKLLKLQTDVTREGLKKANDLIDNSLESDSALFVERKRSDLAKQVVVVAGQQWGKTQREYRDLLGLVGTTSDPEELGRIMERLRAFEEKGAVRETVVAQDAKLLVEQRAKRLTEHADALAKLVEEGRQQQEEILAQFFGPTRYEKLLLENTFISSHDAQMPTKTLVYNLIIFNSDNTFRTRQAIIRPGPGYNEKIEDKGFYGFVERGTWSVKGNRVTLKFEKSRSSIEGNIGDTFIKFNDEFFRHMDVSAFERD